MKPEVLVSLSHELAPVIKEYERTATTAINTFVGKATGRYLSALGERLKQAGYKHAPVIMQSSGGVAPVEEAQARAAALLASGPAGGVIGAVALGQVLGYENLITTDVGGTSFDVGLGRRWRAAVFADAGLFPVPYGAAQHRYCLDWGRRGQYCLAGTDHQFTQGRTAERWVLILARSVTGLAVSEPTVTDANVVLKRLNPDFFLGGQRKLDPDLARQAIETKIAGPLEPER